MPHHSRSTFLAALSTLWHLYQMRTWGIFALLLASPALGQTHIDPNSGIEFVTVGAVGNAAWQGDGTEGDVALNRGQVNYQYGIGKFEVTTSQWVEFFNAAYDRPAEDWLPHVTPPTFWGAVGATPNTPGGLRWAVPAGNAMRPVGNISWRMAAMYCNWLCNDKSTDRAAFMSGAYDVGTFGYLGASSIFTDQLTHNSGARYWIPTLDEWLKAAHYDPAKPNADGTVGGWWKYSTTSDAPVAYGPPGVNVRPGGSVPGLDPTGPLAQANGNWDSSNFPGYDPFTTPLGAYSDVQSPWGLYDTSGGTAEWNEGANLANTSRFAEGTMRGAIGSPAAGTLDSISRTAGGFPSDSSLFFGLRIASSVPSPSAFSLGLGASFLGTNRNRRTRHARGHRPR